MTTTAAVTKFQLNPFETARAKLIEGLKGLSVPRPIQGYPDDFETASAHIKEAVALFDGWLSAVGFEVRHSAPCKVNSDLFNDVISEAVIGWATGEVDRCATIAQADLEEAADERAVGWRR